MSRIFEEVFSANGTNFRAGLRRNPVGAAIMPGTGPGKHGAGPHTGGGQTGGGHAAATLHGPGPGGQQRGEHISSKRQSTILNGRATAPATNRTVPLTREAKGFSLHAGGGQGRGPQGGGAHTGGGQAMGGAHTGGGHPRGGQTGPPADTCATVTVSIRQPMTATHTIK